MNLTTDAKANPVSTDRVLMVIREDSRNQDLMLEREALVMLKMIESAGYEVDIVTLHDQPLTGNVTVKPDLRFDDVDLTQYNGLMLPCMAAEPDKTMPEKILPLIQQAVELNLPIGAMRGSVRELARAGALEGHRYSFAMSVDVNQHPEFKSAFFEGSGVTSDRKITTAGVCPLAAHALGETDGTVQLTEMFIATLQTNP